MFYGIMTSKKEEENKKKISEYELKEYIATYEIRFSDASNINEKICYKFTIMSTNDNPFGVAKSLEGKALEEIRKLGGPFFPTACEAHLKLVSLFKKPQRLN